MEFLTEFAIELLGGFLVDAGADTVSDRRRPMWLRILILAGLGLLFTAVFAILLIVGIGAFQDLPLISLFLFALDAAFVFVAIRKLRKILRTLSQ